MTKALGALPALRGGYFIERLLWYSPPPDRCRCRDLGRLKHMPKLVPLRSCRAGICRSGDPAPGTSFMVVLGSIPVTGCTSSSLAHSCDVQLNSQTHLGLPDPTLTLTLPCHGLVGDLEALKAPMSSGWIWVIEGPLAVALITSYCSQGHFAWIYYFVILCIYVAARLWSIFLGEFRQPSTLTVRSVILPAKRTWNWQ